MNYIKDRLIKLASCLIFDKNKRKSWRNKHLKNTPEHIKLFMTLLVKNEEDILENNIRFHKAMGVDGFIVTSHNSTDNTNVILKKLKEEGIVNEIIYETSPKYEQATFVDRMIKIAKDKYKADWIINADADEFFYAENHNLKKGIFDADVAGLNCIVPDIINYFSEDKENYLYEGCLFYKRTKMYTKVIHNTKDYMKIRMGNHNVDMKNKNKRLNTSDIYIYHYHIRNYKGYEEKVKRYIDTELASNIGTHMQHMIDLYKNGRLIEDYNARYGDDVKNKLLREGNVLIDKNISNFLNKNFEDN